MAKPTTSGELALIERIRQHAGTRRGAVSLGIGDDCAILRVPRGHEVVVTTDFSLEGRHFRRDLHSPRSIGHRTLARGLSDLAAMGARPLAAFLSLALPKSVARDKRWLDAFLDGLLTLARLSKVPLAGGDTSESPADFVLADIVLLGAVPAGRALRRDGAHPGDLLYVTNALGGAAAELSQLLATPLQPKAKPALRHNPPAVESSRSPHFFPQPRLRLGRELLRHRLATAAIDLSDGLSTDLAHLCTASGVAAELDAAAIPIHDSARTLLPDGPARLNAALHGGEDYELLFAARPGATIPRSLAGVRLTRIGRLIPRRARQPQLTLIDSAGRRHPLPPQGWQHLA
jgi:thiamine-monophosphate kinase